MKRRFATLVFVAVAIYAVAGAIFAWAHSHFLRDDFAGFFIAQHERLITAMAMPIDVHFVPLHRLVKHLVYAFAPMNFTLAVALLLAVHLGALALVYALQRLRDTRANAVLLFFYGTNVQLGVLFVWWTSGLHRLP